MATLDAATYLSLEMRLEIVDTALYSAIKFLGGVTLLRARSPSVSI